ncbi:MAG: glycosyltransferase family 39 protein [Dehalococcoidia bacterium]|nr:glycosyltransferase family 39 protein [Dehalococcoidia bacterium]
MIGELPRRATSPKKAAGGAVPLLVVACVLVGFALRFGLFSTEELGLDGHLSVGLASIPVGDMLAFNLRDVHPPLFYLTLRAWLGLVSTNFIAAKWLSIASGILAIPVLYQIAKRTMGPLAGLMAAMLLTVSPAHIFLSATVRDFAPGMLLSTTTLLLLILLVGDGEGRKSRASEGVLASDGEILSTSRQSFPSRSIESGQSYPHRQRGFSRRELALGAGLSVTTGCALLTWYFHGLPLLLEVGYLIIARPRRWRLAAVALLAGIAISLPWLAYAAPPLLAKVGGGITVSGEAPRLLEFSTFAAKVASSVAGVGLFSWAVLLAYWVALLILGAVFAMRLPRLRLLAIGSLAGTTMGLGLTFLLAGLWVYSTFLTRYVLIPLPFAILAQSMLATASRVVWRRVAVMCLAALLIPSGLWYLQFIDSGPIPYDQDPVSLYLEPRLQPGDAVIFTDIARLGFYRLRNENPVFTYAIHFTGSSFLEDNVKQRTIDLIPAVRRQHKRIWLVNSEYDKRELASLVEEALGKPLAERVVLSNSVTSGEVLSFAGLSSGPYR